MSSFPEERSFTKLRNFRFFSFPAEVFSIQAGGLPLPLEKVMGFSAELLTFGENLVKYK